MNIPDSTLNTGDPMSMRTMHKSASSTTNETPSKKSVAFKFVEDLFTSSKKSIALKSVEARFLTTSPLPTPQVSADANVDAIPKPVSDDIAMEVQVVGRAYHEEVGQGLSKDAQETDFGEAAMKKGPKRSAEVAEGRKLSNAFEEEPDKKRSRGRPRSRQDGHEGRTVPEPKRSRSRRNPEYGVI
jgi:hypothetical protein